MFCPNCGHVMTHIVDRLTWLCVYEKCAFIGISDFEVAFFYAVGFVIPSEHH